MLCRHNYSKHQEQTSGAGEEQLSVVGSMPNLLLQLRDSGRPGRQFENPLHKAVETPVQLVIQVEPFVKPSTFETYIYLFAWPWWLQWCPDPASLLAPNTGAGQQGGHVLSVAGVLARVLGDGSVQVKMASFHASCPSSLTSVKWGYSTLGCSV